MSNPTAAEAIGGRTTNTKDMITMNKKLNTLLLSATVLGSGLIGAGSLVANATDDGIASSQTVDETVDEIGNETAVATALQASDETPAADSTDDMPGRRDRRDCGDGEAVAEVLGLTTDELRTAREGGASLAEIAEEQGVALDDVVQAIVEHTAERLDAKLAAGDVTAEEAEQRLVDAEAHALEKVNRTADA